MKSIHYAGLIPLLSISLCTYAQTGTPPIESDSLEVQLIDLPKATSVGVPYGKLASQEIGPSGGTLTSADGRIRLNFPAGALSSATMISIQPSTHSLPNGSGTAYRLEPSGTRFAKPVELIFHCTKEEEELCPIDLKFMALQSGDGSWEYMEYEDWDSTTRSLKGFISHFSVFLNGNEVTLVPEQVTVKVSESHRFELRVVQPPPPPSAEGEDELVQLPKPAQLVPNQKAKWYVNDHPGGNDQVGMINALNRKAPTATYVAPKNLPSDEFVTVRLKVFLYYTEKKSTRRKSKAKIEETKTKKEELATLTAKVRLYDEYSLTIEKKGHPFLICGAEIEDRSSFDVKLFPGRPPEISNVQNSSPTLTKQASCKPLKYETKGCLGPVHVNSNLLVKHSVSGSPPIVEMEFRLVEVKVVHVTGKHQNEIDVFPAPDTDVNVPDRFSFKANRTNQRIAFGKGNGAFVLVVSPK